jgi:Cobalamin biosynthesis protein CobT VWA domain
MAYQIFTRDFDEIVDAATFGSDTVILSETAARLDQCLAGVRDALGASPPPQRRDTVITLLVDHSGSMRGAKIVQTAGLVEGIAELLYRSGVPHEILGFTTVAWKGGRSREKWLAEGKPADPGRLNDLRHIVYRTAGDPMGPTPASLRGAMFKEGILRENIDGEAIEWAAGRLRQRAETRKILLLLSDGAPVDDSTGSVNGDAYLTDHLEDVLAALLDEGAIRVAAIGIGFLSLPAAFRDKLIVGERPLTAADVVAHVFPFVSRLVDGGPSTGLIDGPLAVDSPASGARSPTAAVRATPTASTSVPVTGTRTRSAPAVKLLDERHRELLLAIASSQDASWARDAEQVHAELTKVDLTAAGRLRHTMGLAAAAYGDSGRWHSALHCWFMAAAREIAALKQTDLPAATSLLEEMADQSTGSPSFRQIFAHARKALHAEGVTLDYGAARIIERRMSFARSNIAVVPEDLAVSLLLDVSECRRLKALPANLTVGVLLARECLALETLPAGLQVSYLDLSGCSALTKLPDDIAVQGGYLRLRGCSRLTGLPRGLRPLAHLDIADCLNITELPDDLAVTGSIDIGGSGITQLPPALANVQLRWRGVPVDARTAFHPETLTAAEILAERNTEVRRVMTERFGLEKLMSSSEATVLDEDRDPGGRRRLLRIAIPDDEPLVCVNVSCPSTGRQYMLRVPPAMTTCRQAIAWTAGFNNPDDYRPAIET